VASSGRAWRRSAACPSWKLPSPDRGGERPGGLVRQGGDDARAEGTWRSVLQDTQGTRDAWASGWLLLLLLPFVTCRAQLPAYLRPTDRLYLGFFQRTVSGLLPAYRLPQESDFKSYWTHYDSFVYRTRDDEETVKETSAKEANRADTAVQEVDRGMSHGHAPTDQESPSLGAAFVMVAEPPTEGRLAWIVVLDSGSTSGAWYDRGAFRHICWWKARDGEGLEFRTAVTGEGEWFEFSGEPFADGFRGMLTLFEAPAIQSWSASAILHRIRTTGNGRAGIYTNYSYDRGADRVSGADLFLLPGTTGVHVWFRFVGPGMSGPVPWGPFAGAEVQAWADSIRFTVKLPRNRIATFIGALAGDSLLLVEAGPPFISQLMAPTSLQKQAVVSAFLSRERVGRCP
jgi:hypothetical protein